MYLGERLGLYRVLAEAQGLTMEELAGTAGIHPRYAREWLEQQAVAALLAVSDDGEGGRRTMRNSARTLPTALANGVAELQVRPVGSNNPAPGEDGEAVSFRRLRKG